MCGDAYRRFIQRQHEVLEPVARRVEQFAWLSITLTLALFIAVGVSGIVLRGSVNLDLLDVTAPTESVYYERYVKYKDVFAYNSTSFYQPQWAMDLQSMFLAVIMYPAREDQRPVRVDDLSGMDTMNEFFRLVEEFQTDRNQSYSDLCAKMAFLSKDKCIRLNLTEPFKEQYHKGTFSLLRMMTKDKGPEPHYTLAYPAQLLTLGDDLVVLPLSNVFGSSKRGEKAPTIYPCPQPIGKTGEFFNGSCMFVGENAERVESVRYGWFLRYDTQEDKDESYKWLKGIHDNCFKFSRLANQATGNAGWKFKCFSNIAPVEGGIEATKSDMKFAGFSLIMAMLVPVLFMIKPCCENNFAPLLCIAIGIFWCTLVAAVGIGSFMGLQIVYTFIIVVIFLQWFYLRLCLFVTDSLKECLLIKDATSAATVVEGGNNRVEEDFPTVFAHWVPILTSSSAILSLCSFLAYSVCMYKLIYFPAAFLGVFFILAAISMLFVFLPCVARILKSRNEGGSPCCMGRDRNYEMSDPVVNNPLITQIKRVYKKHVILASIFTRAIIVCVFLLFFAFCLFKSVLILSAEQSDEAYYGYEKGDLFLPESEISETFEVMKTYYPDTGVGVQLIFNNKAKYWNDIGLDNFTACPEQERVCYFHSDLILQELFPALWDSSDHMRPRFGLSFYQIFVTPFFDDGEKKLVTEQDFKFYFNPKFFSSGGGVGLFNDVARVNLDQLPQPPYKGRIEGDPYTRMYVGTKFLTHTAKEVDSVIKLEQAQQKLKESASFELDNYFPYDSFEIYSPMFLLTESSRDILSRTVFFPVVLLGAVLFVPVFACFSVPHPLAHLAVYCNTVMLFFEFFAMQVVLGTTLNNISMAFYFLLYLFAFDFSFYASHMNLKYYMMRGGGSGCGVKVPLPSPIPSLATMVTAFICSMIILMKSNTVLFVAVRNCMLTFGFIGPLHEIFFIPCFISLFVGVGNDQQNKEKESNVVNGVELKENSEKEKETPA